MNSKITFLGIGQPVLDYSYLVSDSDLPIKKGGQEVVEFSTFENLRESLTDSICTPYAAGSTGNLMKAISCLGEKCYFSGITGSDLCRKVFKKGLSDRNITLNLLKHSSKKTAQSAILITPDGERTMFTHLGAANESFSLDPELFLSDQHIHIEGYLISQTDLIENIFERCMHKKGVTISLDLASNFTVANYRECFLSLFKKKKVNILFGNEDEMKELTGNSVKESCLSLSKFFPTVVATLGEKGCIVVHQGKLHEFPAKKVTSVIDTTGAGDYFMGGFIQAYKRNEDLATCAERGATLASKIIQVYGTDFPEA